jgi:fermentation-respiration switch protein FrsA (DUF1100 family)
MVIYIGAGLVAAWLIASLTLIVFARTLIYPFRPGISAAATVGIPRATAITFVGEDGTDLTAWIVPPSPGRPVILYFMGNGGSLPGDGPRLSEFVHRGFGIAAMNYRGAGGAPGKPTQEALTSDAVQFYDTLDTLIGQPVAPEDRIIYGSSLGAAVAVQLASRRETAALILEAPFNRMCEVAEHRFPIFPACLLLPYEHWASADLIGMITAPVLILHGDADQSIPLSQGQALFNAANQPKGMIVYPGGNHNDLRLYGAGIDAINFIENLAQN